MFLHTLGRLVLLYLVPLLLLGVFFHLEYRHLERESARAHLEVIAEHQANTFDLFLRERLANLRNVVEGPAFAGGRIPPDAELTAALASIRQTSDAFVDLGVVSGDGDLVAYVGPVRYAPGVNYAEESWFRDLLAPGHASVITGIYLGVRGLPHFTIAVRRAGGPAVRVLRAALSPERLADYLTSLEGASEVHAAIVDAGGILQVSTPRVGRALHPSPFVPPRDPKRGFLPPDGGRTHPGYAWAWLGETPWALVVTDARARARAGVLPFGGTLFLPTASVVLAVAAVILVRTRQVVRRELATERHQAELSGQLAHAARLASVGELAAGIAHEINNPLAVVAEEVGVLKDALDPELAGDDDEPLDLAEHLDAIHEAVFRCRDITRKLLGFVRRGEVRIEPHDLRDILDDVLDALLGNELAISNVEVKRRFDPGLPPLPTDRTQLVQVFVNLVKNAVDAMPGGGSLTVTTELVGDRARVTVADTGCGMTPAQLERVFMPFFTTKDPGQGTGLGLSVSYSIVRGFGGDMRVESAPGRGSIFTVELPLAPA